MHHVAGDTRSQSILFLPSAVPYVHMLMLRLLDARRRLPHRMHLILEGFEMFLGPFAP